VLQYKSQQIVVERQTMSSLHELVVWCSYSKLRGKK